MIIHYQRIFSTMILNYYVHGLLGENIAAFYNQLAQFYKNILAKNPNF